MTEFGHIGVTSVFVEHVYVIQRVCPRHFSFSGYQRRFLRISKGFRGAIEDPEGFM